MLGNLDSVCAEYGLCLCAYKDPDNYIPSGTAVMIGPGIAMTARHVIEDFFKQYDNREFIEGKPHSTERGTFSLLALHPLSGAQWVVNLNYFIKEKPDIAFLWLLPDNEQAKNRTSIFATINLDFPLLGKGIFAYGFTDIEGHDPGPTIDFGNGMKRVLVYSTGIVKEIHDEYRDTGRLSFPCFQTDARFDGGMSGGPVFNENKEVIGLVCSSLPATAEFEEHISYASILWPSMLIPISVPFPNQDLPDRYPIQFLAEKGIMNVKGWEKCTLVKHENGTYYKEIRRLK